MEQNEIKLKYPRIKKVEIEKTFNGVHYWCYGYPNIECGKCPIIKECVKEYEREKKRK